MTKKEKLERLEENLGKIASTNPEVMTNFKDLKESVMKEGILTPREKTLVALGIVISKQCGDCILSWVNTAIEKGITFEELVEVCGVTMLLNGGPGAAYSCQAVENYQELKDK